jgi:hypothetical protein
MSVATIYRAQKDREHPYKSLRRATFEDNRLSFEARGVLAYILVKPDDWRVNVKDLMKQGGTGRDRVYRILKELIDYGYCKHVEHREKGQIVGYSYAVYEEPLTDSPLPEKPYTAEPDTENKEHTKEEVSTKEEATTKEEEKLAAAPHLITKAEYKKYWLELQPLPHDRINHAKLGKQLDRWVKEQPTFEYLKDLDEYLRAQPFYADQTIYPEAYRNKMDEYDRYKQRLVVTNGVNPSSPQLKPNRTEFDSMADYHSWAAVHDPDKKSLYEVTIRGTRMVRPGNGYLPTGGTKYERKQTYNGIVHEGGARGGRGVRQM